MWVCLLECPPCPQSLRRAWGSRGPPQLCSNIHGCVGWVGDSLLLERGVTRINRCAHASLRALSWVRTPCLGWELRGLLC